MGNRVALEAEIAQVLNRYSQENGSNTPDWVLANYLFKCLAAFNEATNAREKWYGRPPSLIGDTPPDGSDLRIAAPE